jgi:signal transduction histidine kinase
MASDVHSRALDDEAAAWSASHSEAVHLTADSRGLVTSARVADGTGGLLPRFRSGARLEDVLRRLDAGLADAVSDAAEDQVPLVGMVPARIRGRERIVEYRVEPHCGDGGSAEIELRVGPPTAAADLADSLRGSQALATSLAEVLSLQDRSFEPSAAARAYLPLIAKAVSADSAAVLAVGPDDRAEVLAAFGETRRRGFPYRPVDLDNPCLAAVTQHRGVCMKRAAGVSSLPAGLLDLCPRHPALVGVLPAFSGHVLRGLLVVAWRRHDAITSGELSFLRVASDGLGLSLAYTALSQQTEMTEVVLDTAGAVARTVLGTLDLEETFLQIARSAARVMGDCRCLLLVSDPEAHDLVAVASSDPAGRGLIGLTVAVAEVSDLLLAGENRRGIVVDDIEWSAQLSAGERQRLQMQSALFMPVRAEEDLIGALLLYSQDRRDEYSPWDVARAESVAEQAASAITNARLFADLSESQRQMRALFERVARVRQEQRTEMASQIHDDIVQTMVAALFEAEGLSAQVVDELRPDADRVTDLLRQAIADARHVIGDLRPPVLGNLGLVGALEALAERLSALTPVKLDCDLEGGGELSPEIEGALYAIAREALQNAVKHAQAAQILATLGWEPEALDGQAGVVLRVADDGIGCATVAAREPDHFGLTMMEEQASTVGGRLNLVSARGKGYTVEAVLPVEYEARREEGAS